MLTTEAALRKDKAPTTPDMQHRHFAYIAQIIRELPIEELTGDSDHRVDIAFHFARHLKHTNSNFNAERFMRAALGTAQGQGED